MEKWSAGKRFGRNDGMENIFPQYKEQSRTGIQTWKS